MSTVDHGDHSHPDPAHQPIVREGHELTYFEKRPLALPKLLGEKGIITTDEIRRAILSVLGPHCFSGVLHHLVPVAAQRLELFDRQRLISTK